MTRARRSPQFTGKLQRMPENKEKDKKENRGAGDVLQALALATTIGMELAITVVLGYYGGHYLDEKLATGPWLTVAGILAGLATGVTGVFKTLQRFFK